MSGVYEQARQAVEAAVAETAQQESLLKAMMREILRRYAGSRSPADILAEMEFELENLADDGEFHFMRP